MSRLRKQVYQLQQQLTGGSNTVSDTEDVLLQKDKNVAKLNKQYILKSSEMA